MITAQQAREMMPDSKINNFYDRLEFRIKEAIEYGKDSIVLYEVVEEEVIHKLESLGFVVVRLLYSKTLLISWEEVR